MSLYRMAPIFSAVGLFVTPVVTVFRVAVGIEPAQKRADAAMRQCDTRISGTVVEIDRVPVCCDGVAAGEYDILDVSVTFVIRFRGEHPRISAGQALFRLLKVEQRQAQPVYGTRWSPSHPVIDHQPAP